MKSEMLQEENKLAKRIRKIMFLMLAAVPFANIIVVIWPTVIDYEWDPHRITAFLIAGTLLLCAFYIRTAVHGKMTKVRITAFCFFLFFLALSVRLFIISLLQAEPISDFYLCYEYAATGSGDIQYLARYYYLGAYALTLRVFLQIFGASVWNAQVWNAIITSLIPVLIYFTVSHITGKAKAGASAGFLYAVCPSMVIYTTVPSCEHFSQFYLTAAVCVYAFYCKAEKKSRYKWVLGIAAGCLFGCTCIYKNLFLMIVPSVILTAFLYECVSIFEKGGNTAGSFAVTAAQNTLLVAAALLVFKAGVFGVRMELKGNTDTGKGSYSAEVYKGLCIEGNGVWNQDVQQYVHEVLERQEDKKTIDRIFYGGLVRQYKDNPKELLEVLKYKFFIDWCNENYYHWTFSGEGDRIQGSFIGEILFVIVPRIFFLLFSAVIILGLLSEILREGSLQRMQFLFLIMGIISLFSAALILIEAQVRYKSNIMPLLCMFFGFSSDDLSDGVQMLYRSSKKKITKEKRG